MKPKELDSICKVCRKWGVHSITFEGISVIFDEYWKPQSTTPIPKDTKEVPPDTSKVPDDPAQSLSDEDILHWSAGPPQE